MNRSLIRSYAITGAGDITVHRFINGDRTDISAHYEDAEHPARRNLRIETFLDVFRYKDDVLAWNGTPNGHDVPAALSFNLLMRLFIEDVDADEDSPRKL